MDIEAWKEKAQVSIEKLDPGTRFRVKDLFEGVDWNSLSKGDRLSFGRYFKNAVKERTFVGIEYIGKATNNSALYKKNEEV